MCADPWQRPSTTLRSDVQGSQELRLRPAARLSLLSLSKGEASVVYADKAYNDYEIEDLLAEVEGHPFTSDTQEEFKAPVVGLGAVFTVLSSQAGGDGGEPADGVVSQIASCRQCPGIRPELVEG